jgi:anaerobic sulfite reductase subunit B
MFPVALSITRINKHTPAVWSFFMIPQRGPRPEFKAGQVAILEMNDSGNAYIAFASAPDENEFEFLIKHNPASAKVANSLFESRPDNQVVLKNIVGRSFSIEDHRGNDLIFVAMGTGVAPLRSTLRHLLRSRNEYGRLVALYGARTAEDFCFAEEMATEWRERGVELLQVISQPRGDWSGPRGRVQSLLDHIAPGLKKPVALICGSQEMIEQTRSRLLNLGLAPEKILTNC